jgi:hypothetical protein
MNSLDVHHDLSIAQPGLSSEPILSAVFQKRKLSLKKPGFPTRS